MSFEIHLSFTCYTNVLFFIEVYIRIYSAIITLYIKSLAKSKKNQIFKHSIRSSYLHFGNLAVQILFIMQYLFILFYNMMFLFCSRQMYASYSCDKTDIVSKYDLSLQLQVLGISLPPSSFSAALKTRLQIYTCRSPRCLFTRYQKDLPRTLNT